MKLEVNVTKKRFFVLLGVILIFAGVFAVYAYNSAFDNPAVMGHSAGEIEGVVKSADISGFCMFSYDIKECPPGWSRKTDFEDRAIRPTNIELLGDGSYSAGSQVLAADGGVGGNDRIVAACGGECSNQGETVFGFNMNNWPRYANVIVCCKD